MPSPWRHHWDLDPDVVFLNHGSFGACPRVVRAAQSDLRDQMECQPVRFFTRELPGLWDSARARLADFIAACPEDLAFVANATTGVNTALSAFELSPGQELLVTDHTYNACHNAARRHAEAHGAEVRVARLPFPLQGPQDVLRALLDAVSPHTKLAIIDHVTSPTGLLLPVAELVQALKARGVECIVDGAHALGMVPINVQEIGAAMYTCNAHKWLCAPKGAAMLHVRRDLQDRLRPLVTSHGMNRPIPGRPQLWVDMDWQGTRDPTPWLSIPSSLDFLQALMPAGWSALAASNHALVDEAREMLCEALGTAPGAPRSMLGSLASVVVPGQPQVPQGHSDPLQDQLFEAGFEVPVFNWAGQRILRISAQAYNHIDEYAALCAQLSSLLPALNDVE